MAGRSFSRLIAFLDSHLRSGRIEIIDYDGHRAICGPAEMPLIGSVELRSPNLIARMLAKPGLAVATAYSDGHWRVANGDLADIITTLRTDFYTSLPPSKNIAGFGRKVIDALLMRKSDSKNVEFHYDIGNEFYEIWLDPELIYSCAYYQDPADSLEVAQEAKARHIAAKLNLRSNDRVLDIGCGWGGMAFHLAQNFGVHVTGISLATQQVAYAKAKAARLGLANSTWFELCDYRSATGSFDAIVSIGMLEHVGKAHLADMFKAVDKLLKPGGTALVHTIGSVAKNPRTNPWIDRNIFPGGYIPSLSQVTAAIECTPLVVSDVETLRMHYAWTLNAWRRRAVERKQKITAMFGERFFRVWEFYLAASEASFRSGSYVNYQVQLIKQIGSLPFTRDYMEMGVQSSPAGRAESLANHRSAIACDIRR